MSELAVERPVQVRRATFSLIASVVFLPPFKLVLDWAHIQEVIAGDVSFAVVDSAITYAFLGFLFLKIHQGRNWARTIFLVILVLGLIIFGLLIVSGFYRMSKWDPPFLIVQGAMQIYALYLVFTPPGNQWVRVVQSPTLRREACEQQVLRRTCVLLRMTTRTKNVLKVKPTQQG